MSETRRSRVPLQPILLGVGFFMLVVISAATVWLVKQSSTDAALVAHTLGVQDKLSNLLLDLRRAESGQRGYLFTNEPAYLDDYRAAIPDAWLMLRQLQEVTSDNPERTAELQRIAGLMGDKIAEMDRSIELNATGNREAARALVLGGSGRDLMNGMRDLTERAIRDEGRLLGLRTTTSQNNNLRLLFITLAGAVLIVLIGAASIFLVQRSRRESEQARRTVEATNANLQQIVEYRTADLTEANEEIQRFAYIVSHDLRSPLVNIMGFTGELESLRQDIFDEMQKLVAEMARLNALSPNETETVEKLGKDFDEAIRFIKTSIANMDRLINAVLKLSREGRRQFNPETIDMGAMLTTISETVAHRATELGATIAVDQLPPVESDRLAVQQVFANLIDNALKYGRAGEATQITVSGRTAGSKVLYDVRDNGRGIDPRDHQRVFELFRRSGPQDRPGEGIGLAHVRALVRRLGGTMTLSSELGKGSTFTVTLPRRWSVENRSAA